MIVQCDQCSAKYKLDDNKVTEAGVKIRCKRCQHVFPVYKKPPQTEPQQDNLLFDLEEAAKGPAVLPSSPQDAADLATHDTSFMSEPSTPFFFPEESNPSTAVQEDTSSEDEYSFEFTLPLEPSAPANPPSGTPREEFSFPFESPSPVSNPANKVEEEITLTVPPLDARTPAPQPDDILEFSFAEESPEDEAPFISTPTELLQVHGTQDSGSASVSNVPSELDVSAPARKTNKTNRKRNQWVPELDDKNSIDMEVLISGPPKIEPPSTVPPPRQEIVPDTIIATEPPPEFEEDVPFDVPGVDVPAEEELTEDALDATASVETDEDIPQFSPSEDQTSMYSAETDFPSPLPDDTGTDEFERNEEVSTPSSRRQGPTPMAILGMILGALILLFSGGVGALYMLEGPESLQKIGLGSLAQLIKPADKIHERVLIKNLEGSYINTSEGKELFVLRGEALNLYPTPHAAIQVRGLIYNSAGTIILQKTSYCGNPLTPQQLATLPLPKIEEAMNNKLGASYANIGVPPGKTVPFVIAFPNLPKDAVDFGVEVATSQPVGDMIMIK